MKPLHSFCRCHRLDPHAVIAVYIKKRLGLLHTLIKKYRLMRKKSTELILALVRPHTGTRPTHDFWASTLSFEHTPELRRNPQSTDHPPSTTLWFLSVDILRSSKVGTVELEMPIYAPFPQNSYANICQAVIPISTGSIGDQHIPVAYRSDQQLCVAFSLL